MRRNRFLLDFPNNEVKDGFLTALATSREADEAKCLMKDVCTTESAHH